VQVLSVVKIAPGRGGAAKAGRTTIAVATRAANATNISLDFRTI